VAVRFLYFNHWLNFLTLYTTIPFNSKWNKITYSIFIIWYSYGMGNKSMAEMFSKRSVSGEAKFEILRSIYMCKMYWKSNFGIQLITPSSHRRDWDRMVQRSWLKRTILGSKISFKLHLMSKKDLRDYFCISAILHCKMGFLAK
jgi:hypothetical protein